MLSAGFDYTATREKNRQLQNPLATELLIKEISVGLSVPETSAACKHPLVLPDDLHCKLNLTRCCLRRGDESRTGD
jgi:hypothetical protein